MVPVKDAGQGLLDLDINGAADEHFLVTWEYVEVNRSTSILDLMARLGWCQRNSRDFLVSNDNTVNQWLNALIITVHGFICLCCASETWFASNVAYRRSSGFN